METEELLELVASKLDVIASNQAQIGIVLMAVCGVILGFLVCKELLKIWIQ